MERGTLRGASILSPFLHGGPLSVLFALNEGRVHAGRLLSSSESQ